MLRRISKFCGDSSDKCIASLSSYDRQMMMDMLAFLLRDLEVHKKRAYLGKFLKTPTIPIEYSHDDGISIFYLK